MVEKIVSEQSAAAATSATRFERSLVMDSASAQRAMAVAFALGLGLIAFFALVITRISTRLNEARAAEFETMAQMASTDPLTGLRNHRAFHEELAQDLRGQVAVSRR